VLHAREVGDLALDRVLVWLRSQLALEGREKPPTHHRGVWDLALEETPEFTQATKGFTDPDGRYK